MHSLHTYERCLCSLQPCMKLPCNYVLVSPMLFTSLGSLRGGILHDLHLPLQSYSMPATCVRKGARREQEPSRGAWKETIRGARYLRRFSRSPSSPGGNPAQRRVLPPSKLLLGAPGGGDGGGCWSPALSPAASGRGGAEAGASERRAPPRSRPAPGRPARLARSRFSPLVSRGIVFPRPPPPPPPGLGHATFSRLRPPRPPLPLLLCLPLSASAKPMCPERRRASGEGCGK
nr:espin-like [Equus asinus]